MNVNRRPWMTADEYLAEKEGMQRATSLLGDAGTTRTSGAMVSRKNGFQGPRLVGGYQDRQARQTVLEPIKPVTITAPNSATGNTLGSDNVDENKQQPLTQQQGNAQLTTAYTSQQMNEALQSLVDFNNRKFKYNPKESPLYTILEQQAAEEARLASGRAYARSVANTGGYGSSYATLAAEEASRQVMEGMDDQQYALYQAAKDEFEAERQSRLDWYNMMKQVNADAIAKEEYEKLKEEEEAKAAGGVTENVQNAYNAVVQIWDGTNEAQVRSALKNQGLTDAEIESTVSMLREDTGAAIADTYKQFEISPTLSGASEIVTEAKQIGIYEEVAGQVSATLSKSITDAMDDLSTGYKVMGVDQTKWDEMDDASKADMIIQSAGEAVKLGIISGEDFEKVINKDMTKGLQDAFKGEWKIPVNKMKDALDVISGIMSLEDGGYLTAEQSEKLLEKARENSHIKDIINDYGEKFVNNNNLSKTQEEAYMRLIGQYGKRGGR